jgi:hypothetical protein
MFTFPPFGLTSLEPLACFGLTFLEPLACFGLTFSPFGIKSPKIPKQLGPQGNWHVLANIAQRKMLNTREKAS